MSREKKITAKELKRGDFIKRLNIDSPYANVHMAVRDISKIRSTTSDGQLGVCYWVTYANGQEHGFSDNFEMFIKQ